MKMKLQNALLTIARNITFSIKWERAYRTLLLSIFLKSCFYEFCGKIWVNISQSVSVALKYCNLKYTCQFTSTIWRTYIHHLNEENADNPRGTQAKGKQSVALIRRRLRSNTLNTLQKQC